jgi:hypothetical protein
MFSAVIDNSAQNEKAYAAGGSGACCMHFSVARPDVVRAVNQRWLLKTWKRLKGAQRIPAWPAMEAEDLSRVKASLSFLEVSGGDGTARFLVRFHGEAIAKVYGSSDCREKFLDQIIPAERHAESLAPYHRALETGDPVYTIHDVTDRNGRLVYYERLLLPYTTDGRNIDRIVASFEFICPDGAFAGDALMKSPAVPPTLRLSATIETLALT